MARTTAPEGFESNYSAVLELLRFGFGIWSLPQMAALLYHVERSTAVGKDADQHSQRQAVDGVYSTRLLCWIRGPAGISTATWKRANAELEQTDERPDGVLRRRRRTEYSGRNDATEYELDWDAISRVIGKWKAGALAQPEPMAGEENGKEGAQPEPSKNPGVVAQPEPSKNPGGLAQPEPMANGVELRGGLAQPEPMAKSAGGDWLSLSQSNGAELRGGLAQPEPYSQSSSSNYRRTDSTDPGLFEVRPSESPNAREARHPSAAAIATEIEAASGERPRTDALVDRILNVGQKFSLPEEALIRWIWDKCNEVRARGAMLSAGLLGKAIGEDIIPWIKLNREFIVQCQQRVELERLRKAEVTEMPVKRSAERVEPSCGPEVAPPSEPDPVTTLLSAEVGRVLVKTRAAAAAVGPVAAEEACDEREASRRATAAALRAARKADVEQRKMELRQKGLR